MNWFRKKKEIDPNAALERESLDKEKRLLVERTQRTSVVVDSLRELRTRNQFRDQIMLTLTPKDS